MKAIDIYNKMTSDNPIDTWDYQLLFNIWHQKGLNIIPINNLCKNIGFGHVDAAHTIAANSKIDFHVVKSCYPLNHPKMIEDCKELDKITFIEMYTSNYGLFYKLKRAFQILKSYLHSNS